MIPTPTGPAATAGGTGPDHDAMARGVTDAALAAYEAVAPHYGRDSLACFLAAELYGGSTGETESARFERAARQVDSAIASLEHVRDQLGERACTSACLPLPLAAAA